MEGISLDFHCFKALNNNLEARLFLHVHFYASSDLLMACRTMQVRFFFKTGNSVNLCLKLSELLLTPIASRNSILFSPSFSWKLFRPRHCLTKCALEKKTIELNCWWSRYHFAQEKLPRILILVGEVWRSSFLFLGHRVYPVSASTDPVTTTM